MFSLRAKYSNSSQAVLDKYGDEKITEIKVMRTPLHNMLQNLMNYFSSGKSKAQYDDLFHLCLLVTVESGKVILVEKNEEIDISLKSTIEPNSEIKNVSLQGKTLTLNEMLNKTQKAMGTKNYFTYNALSLNCQNFVINILKSNGILTDDIYKFTYQDMSQLIKSTPKVYQKFIQFVTNSKAWLNKVVGSSDKKKCGRIKNT